jgi:glycosyltransferase involved in cell wall biosynthesis
MIGSVLRNELVHLMVAHEVFVFPTLAEGSARVVFEAMAAGMAVITTPNAGSVVEHEKHGLLIRPGDAAELRDAIQNMMDDRERISVYGNNARKLVEREYHSGIYRKKVISLYQWLAGGGYQSDVQR